jgi:hypothetical protein
MEPGRYPPSFVVFKGVDAVASKELKTTNCVTVSEKNIWKEIKDAVDMPIYRKIIRKVGGRGMRSALWCNSFAIL